MTIIEEGWTVFQAASLLYYGEAIVRDTASVESYVFEIDEVEFIYVPWTHVQGARDRFAFHMYQWEDRKGSLVEGWQVTDEASERILLHGMKREGDEVPFRMEYDMNGQIQLVEANSPYVLISERAANIHRDTVRRTLKSLSESVQLHLYPHLFRRTCATLLLKRGVPIVTVSKILGHHSVDMTSQMYIHTSREDKQAALELL